MEKSCRIRGEIMEKCENQMLLQAVSPIFACYTPSLLTHLPKSYFPTIPVKRMKQFIFWKIKYEKSVFLTISLIKMTTL